MLIENHIVRNFASQFPRSDLQLNGLLEADAELIQLGDNRVLAVTTDNIVEEISTGLYDDPENVGWLAVTVNLSDLAAVGAEPMGMLINLVLPEDIDQRYLEGIQKGITNACNHYNVPVFGGDTNTGKDIQVGGVAIGMVCDEEAIMRKGAKPGDLLFTTNPLGQGGFYAFRKLITKDGTSGGFYPEAQIEAGKLVRRFASACIDTSDGFFSATSNLMEVNQIGIKINLELNNLVDAEIQSALQPFSIPPWFMLAGPHGEFELLFTINRDKLQLFLNELKTTDWTPICIGEIITDPFIFFPHKGCDHTCKPQEIANLYNLCKGDVHKYINELNKLNESWKQ